MAELVAKVKHEKIGVGSFSLAGSASTLEDVCLVLAVLFPILISAYWLFTINQLSKLKTLSAKQTDNQTKWMSKISLQLVFQESDDKLSLEMDDNGFTKTDSIKNLDPVVIRPSQQHLIQQHTSPLRACKTDGGAGCPIDRPSYPRLNKTPPEQQSSPFRPAPVTTFEMSKGMKQLPAGRRNSRGRNLTCRDHNSILRRDLTKEILNPSRSDWKNHSKRGNVQRPPNETKRNLRSHSSSWFNTRNSNSNASRSALSTKFQDRQDRIKSPSQNQNNHINHVSAKTDWVAGLNMDKFLPASFQHQESMGSWSSPSLPGFNKGTRAYDDSNSLLALEHMELELMANVVPQHRFMMTVLCNRHRNLKIVCNLWRSKDGKVALETAVKMNDPAVMVDILSLINFRPYLLSLDLCVLLLPPIAELLNSTYEVYVTTACYSLRLVLKNFATIIKNNIAGSTESVGVDIPRQERFNKCMKCHSHLLFIKIFVLRRKTFLTGKMKLTFEELQVLLETLG